MTMVSDLNRKSLCLSAALMFVLQACSDDVPVSPQNSLDPGSAGNAASAASNAFDPASALSFEWSANGFEQVESRYQWMGTGKRDDVYQPNFSLSVPETDDILWSSGCEPGGKVVTQLYFAAPKDTQGNRATLKFETDRSTKTLTYPATYSPTGQFEGFEIVQSADDPMFAEMMAGSWAYLQIGKGSDALKLRISLANAAKSLKAFLPACVARPASKLAATRPAQSYACDNGRTVTARYMGNDTDTPAVRLDIEGTALILPQTMSGSGARYESEAGGKKYYWLTKADEGVLIVGDANDADGSTEKTTLCKARL